MSPRRILEACTAILIATGLVWASPARGQMRAAPDSATIERRIGNVTSRLLVESAVPGVYTTAGLRERMAHYHTPGISIAVVNDYRLEWARGFGVREAGSPFPVDTDTRFQAASVSKPTFATVVMRLVEQGRISLDEDVNSYLTSWKVPPVGPWQPRLTLRQILGHGAGLTVHGFLGYDTSEPIPTLLQVLDGVPPANSPPVRVNLLPGIQSVYSGGGLVVAQLAVTDHVGRPLPELAQDLVFAPLGMRRSGYDQPLRDTIDVATGHYWMALPLRGRWHIYPELAAAGLWTTPSDLARLGSSLQRAWRGDSGEILGQASVREMMTPQHLRGDPIGISFFLLGQGDSARFEHGGWNEGYLTDFVMYVQGGRGAVVMANSNEAGDLMSEIMRAIAQEYGWPGYIRRPLPTRALAVALAKRYAGSYLMDDGSRADVRSNGGTLELNLSQAGYVPLAATSDTTFSIPGLDADVTFRRSGESQRLVLSQNGVTVAGRRLARRP